jgi:hypothetical protein
MKRGGPLILAISVLCGVLSLQGQDADLVVSLPKHWNNVVYGNQYWEGFRGIAIDQSLDGGWLGLIVDPYPAKKRVCIPDFDVEMVCDRKEEKVTELYGIKGVGVHRSGKTLRQRSLSYTLFYPTEQIPGSEIVFACTPGLPESEKANLTSVFRSLRIEPNKPNRPAPTNVTPSSPPSHTAP